VLGLSHAQRAAPHGAQLGFVPDQVFGESEVQYELSWILHRWRIGGRNVVVDPGASEIGIVVRDLAREVHRVLGGLGEVGRPPSTGLVWDTRSGRWVLDVV
jgi:hypothetical protein